MKNWFKKKPEVNEPVLNYLPEEHKASIEIVAHRDAHAEAKAEVDKANALLQKLFKDNHFSLTIYLATGGKIKQTKGK